MRNDTARWPATTVGQKPDASSAGVTLRHITPAQQTLISGPRKAALTLVKQKEVVGWPEIATGETYAISMRRDRLIMIGGGITKYGWDDKAGLAISDVSSGYEIMSISGHRAYDVLRTGTELPLDQPSRSALRLWNGYGVILYRHGTEDTYRIHAASAHFEGVWEMLNRQMKLVSES